MDTRYWIVMALFLLGMAISVCLGWRLGIRFAASRFTLERAAMIEEEMRQRYGEHIEQEFHKAVEKRAHEIVNECMKKMEEMENNKDNEEEEET